MKIVAISDTHNQHLSLDNGKLPTYGDVIIHSGDISTRGSEVEVEDFLSWYGSLNYDTRILVAGNHDFAFEKKPGHFEKMCEEYGVKYLNDAGVEINGIRIWGSPVQPKFGNWAFNRYRGSDIKFHWDKIPNDTDILITHGPPANILDQVKMTISPNYGENVGCADLLQAVKRVSPKLHIFGHIHEGRGVVVDKSGPAAITYANAASLDSRYQPYDLPALVFDWEKVKFGDSKGTDYFGG